MVFKKTLNIRCGNIGGKPATLLLCFQVPDSLKVYHDQFPIAWRVVHFRGEGLEDLTTTYTSQLFVATSQIVSGTHVKPDQWITIDPGQKTTLAKIGATVKFTDPVLGSYPLIIAENHTENIENFAIGIVEERNTPIPLFYFPHVGQGYGLRAKIDHLLQAYVYPGLQESTVLKGNIETRTPIWTQELTELPDLTNWVFEQDPDTGVYVVVRRMPLRDGPTHKHVVFNLNHS